VLIAGGDRAGVYEGDTMRQERLLPLLADSILAGGWTDAHSVVLLTADGVIRSIDTRADPAAARVGPLNTWCFAVEYSPEGGVLAIGNSGVVSIVDGASLAVRATIPLKVLGTRQLKFIPGRSELVSGSTDGTVRILDPQVGAIQAELKSVKSEVFAIAPHPSGKLVFAGYADGSGRIWNLETRSLELELPHQSGRYNAAAYSPDGSRLAVSGPQIGLMLFDPTTGAALTKLHTTSGPWAVAFSTDGSTLLVGTDEGTVEAFDSRTGNPLGVVQAHRRLIAALACSRDGRFFATGSDDGDVRLWDFASRRPLLTLSPGGREVPSLSFDPTGRFLAAGTQDRVAVVYDLQAMDASIEGNRGYQRQRLAPSSEIKAAQ
jgi:WD40 repeat protein